MSDIPTKTDVKSKYHFKDAEKVSKILHKNVHKIEENISGCYRMDYLNTIFGTEFIIYLESVGTFNIPRSIGPPSPGCFNLTYNPGGFLYAYSNMMKKEWHISVLLNNETNVSIKYVSLCELAAANIVKDEDGLEVPTLLQEMITVLYEELCSKIPH